MQCIVDLSGMSAIFSALFFPRISSFGSPSCIVGNYGEVSTTIEDRAAILLAKGCFEAVGRLIVFVSLGMATQAFAMDVLFSKCSALFSSEVCKHSRG